MKLLAIETSGKLCGAAILGNNNLIDKIELNNGLTHSESLMPLIKQLLEKNKIKISEFDAFVCDIGPGSFTGIRIGVATIKAFVDTYANVKYTGVSSLEALAYNVKKDGLICSVIDCKNNNCYWALYNLENGKYTEIIPPSTSSFDELSNTLKKYKDNQITFVGNGASTGLDTIKTSNLALAGFNKISSGNILELSPLYLKKPQAQRQLEEKLKKD